MLEIQFQAGKHKVHLREWGKKYHARPVIFMCIVSLHPSSNPLLATQFIVKTQTLLRVKSGLLFIWYRHIDRDRLRKTRIDEAVDTTLS